MSETVTALPGTAQTSTGAARRNTAIMAVYGMIVAPRVTRIAAGKLTIAAASDALQTGYSAATRALR